jgi:hypothetical protein
MPLTCRNGADHLTCRTELSVRDEEAAGSNPATPTEKFQVDGMIAKRGDHAIDRLLAIRWRDRTSVPGMRRGGSAGNAIAAGIDLHGLNWFPARMGGLEVTLEAL